MTAAAHRLDEDMCSPGKGVTKELEGGVGMAWEALRGCRIAQVLLTALVAESIGL